MHRKKYCKEKLIKNNVSNQCLKIKLNLSATSIKNKQRIRQLLARPNALPAAREFSKIPLLVLRVPRENCQDDLALAHHVLTCCLPDGGW